MDQVKQGTGISDNLEILMGLNSYMREKLSVYHVIKIMQPKFQQDIDSLTQKTTTGN